MIVGIYNEGTKIEERLRFVVKFLNDHGLCPKSLEFILNPDSADLKIGYGIELSEMTLFVPTQKLFFTQKWPKLEDIKINRYTFEALNLHSVENDQKESKAFHSNERVQFDIFETIFFHLSRIEEYHRASDEYDQWDLLTASEMILVKNGLEKKPVVDHIVYAFFNLIGLTKNPVPTRFVLSHDIDQIRKFNKPWSRYRKLLGHIKRQEWDQLHKWRAQWKRFRMTNVDPYDVFDWLLVKESNRHQKMIFFLIGGNSKYDSPIPHDDPIFVNSIELAKKRNYTIGIHPSYVSWTEELEFKVEKDTLEKIIDNPIAASRQHYLHFHFPKTISILEKNKVTIDSSLGFNDRIGFRCGTGHTFYLYHIPDERITNVKELPLVIMDSALIKESEKSSLETGLEIRRTGNTFLEDNKFFTRICCNFHNSRFDEAEMNDWPLREFFEKIVQKLDS